MYLVIATESSIHWWYNLLCDLWAGRHTLNPQLPSWEGTCPSLRHGLISHSFAWLSQNQSSPPYFMDSSSSWIGFIKRILFCPKQNVSTIPRYLRSTSVKPRIMCHVFWHILWLASCRIFASLVSVPSQASQCPTSVGLLSQTVCQWLLALMGQRILPPRENDPLSICSGPWVLQAHPIPVF